MLRGGHVSEIVHFMFRDFVPYLTDSLWLVPLSLREGSDSDHWSRSAVWQVGQGAPAPVRRSLDGSGGSPASQPGRLRPDMSDPGGNVKKPHGINRGFLVSFRADRRKRGDTLEAKSKMQSKIRPAPDHPGRRTPHEGANIDTREVPAEQRTPQRGAGVSIQARGEGPEDR